MNKRTASSPRPLVIVESPNKVATISKILGDGFTVKASYGHFADIPAKRGSIDTANNFTATYVPSKKGQEVIDMLRDELAHASELILATDGDREGEMIAFLLVEFLQPTVPVSRIVFNSISRLEVLAALEDRKQIRSSLVEAARTRRYLDYLYGFNVSPVLWSKVRGNLGAGRVQSPALRMVVEREKERLAFVETTYCGIEATLSIEAKVVASLRTIDSVPVAKSDDIDDAGIVAPPAQLLLLADAQQLAAALQATSLTVADSKTEGYSRKPRRPYTTSDLLQDIYSRLKVGSTAAQAIMNQLHEKGLISYPRTDSPSLSGVAMAAARQQAVELFGASCVPEKPRLYFPKRKSAQEAHEAIRPSNMSLRHPKGLSTQQAAVYDLVWRRTVASQMVDTTGTTVTVTLHANTTKPERWCVFTAAGTTIVEPGHRRLYSSVEDDEPTPLAEFTVGDVFGLSAVEVKEHVTRPPARYTDASLIRALEAQEIGRPSTYAPIIQSLRDEYVWSKRGDQALIPTLTGVAVHQFLSTCFPTLIDYTFTREMEEELDSIVEGNSTLVDMLSKFYSLGDGEWPGLVSVIDEVEKSYKPADHDVLTIGVHPETGDPIVLKPGRSFAGKKSVRGTRSRPSRTSGSPYIKCGSRNVAVPDNTELSQLTVDFALQLLNTPTEARVVGEHNGEEVTVKVGPYGPYAKVGARSVSLPAGTDVATVSMADIEPLLAFPRSLGVDPASDEEVVLKRGRYGIYVEKAGDTRPVSADTDPAGVTLDHALELLARPKKGRGKR